MLVTFTDASRGPRSRYNRPIRRVLGAFFAKRPFGLRKSSLKLCDVRGKAFTLAGHDARMHRASYEAIARRRARL